MRRILFCNFFSFLFLSFVLAPNTFAQEKPHVSIEANYLGGDANQQYDYSRGHFSSGETHENNGFQIGAVVPINKTVSIGGRWEENFLRNGQYFDRSRFHSGGGPDSSETSVHGQYGEAYAGIVIPKMTGFRAIGGIMRMKTEQNREFEVSVLTGVDIVIPQTPRGLSVDLVDRYTQVSVVSQDVSNLLGPMVGVEWNRNAGRKLNFSMAGRGYPRLVRGDQFTSGSDSPLFLSDEGGGSSTAYGFEGRGVMGYKVASHVAVQVGYQFRRIYSDWNQTNTDKGLIAGVKFTF